MWQSIARFQRTHGFDGLRRRLIFTNLPDILAFRLGITDPQAFRIRWTEKQARLMAGWTAGQIEAMCESVIEHEFWPTRRISVLEELGRRQADGAQIVLASGMYQPMVERFASRLDFPATAIGTPLEFQEGRFTGRFISPVCNGKEKARRILETTAGAPVLAAYGDSLSDVPMLELSQQPVAVYPSKDLANYARQHGWQIFEDIA